MDGLWLRVWPSVWTRLPGVDENPQDPPDPSEQPGRIPGMVDESN